MRERETMIDRDLLSAYARLNGPAAPERLRGAEVETGCAFPGEYIDLLRFTDGLEVTVNADRYAIGLLGVDELSEMNEAYQVARYLPHRLLIGLDGGGRGLFLDCSPTERNGAVSLCEMGALFEEEVRPIAASLAAWVRNRFDLKDL